MNSLIRQIMSTDSKVSAKAGCEFAQKIWDGEISDEVIAELTHHESDAVREALAWAVWDAQRPSIGVRWLLTDALTDRSDRVRMYAVAYVKDAVRGKDRIPILSIIRDMQHDPSPVVRRIVQEILGE